MSQDYMQRNMKLFMVRFNRNSNNIDHLKIYDFKEAFVPFDCKLRERLLNQLRDRNKSKLTELS